MIEYLKHHLNIDEDYHGDDDYIMLLYSAVKKRLAKHLNLPLLKFNEIEEEEPIKMAIFLMVGNLYNNRENVAFTNTYEVPFTYSYLLSPYINYGITYTNV
jgi:uncharacterized phage protein (predicted DNA packaging)